MEFVYICLTLSWLSQAEVILLSPNCWFCVIDGRISAVSTSVSYRVVDDGDECRHIMIVTTKTVGIGLDRRIHCKPSPFHVVNNLDTALDQIKANSYTPPTHKNSQFYGKYTSMLIFPWKIAHIPPTQPKRYNTGWLRINPTSDPIVIVTNARSKLYILSK